MLLYQQQDATRGIAALDIIPLELISLPDASVFRATPLLEVGVPLIDARAVSEPGVNKALWEAVHEFLMYRYGKSSSPDTYIAWMLSRGFELRPAEELREQWWATEAYQAYTGEAPPPAATAEELFVACMQGSKAYKKGYATFTGVSLEEDWVGFLAGDVSLASPILSPPSTWPERVLALSGRVSSSPSWFQHEDGLQEQFARRGRARVGAVWCVAEFLAGQKRPVRFGLVYSPVLSEWIVTSIAVGCLQDEVSVRCEY